MNLRFFPERGLSDKARDLVDFDIASIRQVLSAAHAEEPAAWLASTDRYEHDGRVLRDTPDARLLAYSPATKALYATDGCNSCTHVLPVELQKLTPEALDNFARDNDIDPALIAQLIASLEPRS